MTQNVIGRRPLPVDGAPWIRVLPLRTPTLPPATHTNVFVVGTGRLLVIDPGSPYPEEQAALDAALDELADLDGERVAEIALTHHHIDHVAGAAHLAARLGVPVRAHPATAARLADRGLVAGGFGDDALPYGPAGLRPLFTPGHAPGHLCFLDVASGLLIAGDMVASQGTILVEPGDGGDMTAYLRSLEELRALGVRGLLPSHGAAIDDARGCLEFYLRHRREREARVLGALGQEARTVEELVPGAYPDVAPALYPLAARSLLAHLIKLETEGRARHRGGRWLRAGDAD